MPESDLKARVLKLATGADPEPQQTPAELAALARADAAEKAHATAVATITRLEADLARERQSTEQRIKDANVAAAALTETLRADLATTRTELATARAECTRHQDCAMESERRAVDALRDVARLTGDLATEKARKVVPPVVVPTEPAAPSVISLDGMEIEVLSRDRNNNIERCRMVTQ